MKAPKSVFEWDRRVGFITCENAVKRGSLMPPNYGKKGPYIQLFVQENISVTLA